MNKYYYLIASFPSPEAKSIQKSSDYEEIILFIKDHLSENDWKLFEYLLYPSDIKNLVNLIARERSLPEVYPFSLQPGALQKNEWEELRKGKGTRNEFFNQFYEDYRDQLDKMDTVDVERILTERFLEKVIREGDSFLTSYFSFDRDLRNTLLIAYSRKINFDAKQYLTGAFSNSNFYSENDGEHNFSEEISHHPKGNNPANLENVLDKIRWKLIDQLEAFSYFDLHTVFARFLKFQLRHRWIGEWTQESTNKRTELLLRHAMESFQVAESFTTKKS